MSEYQEAAELIEDAVEIIDECGWYQGGFGYSHIGYCIMGGLNRANSSNHLSAYLLAGDTLDHFAEKRSAKPYDPSITFLRPVAYFNDKLAQSWDEARDLMMETAKFLREKG